jgi:hypothetical protein
MENGLTKEERIILNILLDKRDKNEIKPKECNWKPTKKEMAKIGERIDFYEAKRIKRMINKT